MKKPTKCPNCGSKNLAKILYGLIAVDEELEEKIDNGKIKLGGCCVTNYDPKFECNDCHAQIYKNGSFEFTDNFKE